MPWWQQQTYPVWHALGPEPCHHLAFRLRSRPTTGSHYSTVCIGVAETDGDPCKCQACGKKLREFVAETTLQVG